MARLSGLLVCFFLWGCASAPPPAPPASALDASPAMRAAQAHLARHEREIVAELRALLELPNLASNTADIERNAALIVGMLERRGASARVLRTPGGADAVFGEIVTPGATRTLLLYAHFDGQPIGDPAAWTSPPFTPTLRLGRAEDGAAALDWETARYPLADEARIYARSASDDKSPIVAALAAIDALRAANIPLSANIKFFLEGEEEAGSPNLERTLRTHRDALGADLWVFADGPIDPRGLPRVVLGARGVTSFAITVFGPATSVHSGHYGNVAPNPGARLAHLIASMRSETGAITIAGFDRAADPISPRSRALAREAFDDAGMLAGPQLPETESGLSYGESVLRTALNLTQLTFASTGAQRNAIDPQATAGFDVRLAPGVSIAEVRALIEAHLRARGYHLVNDAPTREERLAHPRIARIFWGELGYPAAMSAPDHPGVARAIEVMRVATAGGVRVAPILGGSLPIAPIGEVLGASFVVVPIVNPDNNQHAPNENVRMREFRLGVGYYAALLAEGGHSW